jgi:prepilin-type N-terminal cleavage/methylation domain-containing protein
MITASRQPEHLRRGFTLLELLIVMAIISILMSMVFFVMNGLTENAEEEATKTTVNKVARLLEQRIEAFDRAFKGSRRDSYVKATVGLLTAIDGRFDYFRTHPDQAPPAIVLLARKAAFRYEFPQRMPELIITPSDDTNANGLPDVIEQKVAVHTARTELVLENGSEPTAAEIQTRVDSRWARHTANLAAKSDTTESSELLYYTLVVSGTFGSSPVDADQFSRTEVADTDGDGLPEFVDAWGAPLRFYRWPTRLIDPTAPNPFTPDFFSVNDPTEVDPDPEGDESDGMREILSDERLYAGVLIRGLPPAPVPLPGPTGGLTIQRDLLFVDPDDPVGLLYSFIEDPQYTNMGIDLTQEFNEAKYHTPDTYHVPLIVSAGPDGLLGLREPTETVAASGIFGNLAQYKGTTVSSPTPTPDVTEELFDNITSRNRRAGSKK